MTNHDHYADQHSYDVPDLNTVSRVRPENAAHQVVSFLTDEEMDAYRRAETIFHTDEADGRTLVKALAVFHELDRHGPVYQIRDGVLVEFNLGVDGLRD